MLAKETLYEILDMFLTDWTKWGGGSRGRDGPTEFLLDAFEHIDPAVDPARAHAIRAMTGDSGSATGIAHSLWKLQETLDMAPEHIWTGASAPDKSSNSYDLTNSNWSARRDSAEHFS